MWVEMRSAMWILFPLVDVFIFFFFFFCLLAQGVRFVGDWSNDHRHGPGTESYSGDTGTKFSYRNGLLVQESHEGT